jgi:outer membrane protein assembly factor BamA
MAVEFCYWRPTYDSNEASPEFNSTYYKLFNIRFAQYFKNDFEFRYGYRFDKYNLIATRGFFGVAYPYGNYPVTPPERVYYAGGANGIRAWPVRRLGPGSNISTDSLKIDQSGDIKLEANLEYRFKFFWMLEGALFVDAGNVWAINRNDNREGAVFQFNRFYKEIAVGSGVGLRLVTNYFILRTDVGIKLRDPSLPKVLAGYPGVARISGPI